MLEWLGFVVGVIGLALAWKYRPRPPKPVFQSQGLKIIESGGVKSFDEGIDVMYKGNPVPLLTSSIVVFWNDGLGAIKKDDVVAVDPIRCYVPDDAKILRTAILSVSDPNIGLTITESENRPNEIGLSFDHLNAGDGAVLEILHTSEELRPKVAGSIIGGSRSGKVTDLGPITQPFPLPRHTEGAKVRRYMWTFKIAGQRVKISRSVLGWLVFLVIDAIVATLFVRYAPASYVSWDTQSHSFLVKVLASMIAIPVTVGLALVVYTVVPGYIFLEARRIWGQRRRFPKKLNVWN
jgi:hypothetical protein